MERTIYPSTSVKEIMDDLVDKDIISTNELIKLKMDKINCLDPNLVMECRHAELKERRLRNSIQVRAGNKEEAFGVKSHSSTNINEMEEAIIVEEELKKFQKQFQNENRHMNKVINKIKQSGRIRYKSKHVKLKRGQNENTIEESIVTEFCEIQLGSEKKVNAVLAQEKLNAMSLNEDSREKGYDKESDDCNKINTFLGSLEKDEKSNENHDQLNNEQFDDLDRLFKKMEKLHESYENIIKSGTGLNAEYSQQQQSVQFNGDLLKNKCELSMDTVESSYEVGKNTGIIASSQLKEIKSKKLKKEYLKNNKKLEKHFPEEKSSYIASEFADTSDEINKIDYTPKKSDICSTKDEDDVITAQDQINSLQSNDCRLLELNISKYNYLAKKYFDKWFNNYKYKICNKTDDKEQCSTFRNAVESKFDSFISKLQQKMNQRQTNRAKIDSKPNEKESKCKIKPASSESFKNRFKAQKDIIDKQRLILEEQRKKIEQLEKDENKNKNELIIKNKTEINNNRIIIKHKKCNQDLTKTKEPTFLHNMNERAKERKEKRQQLKQLIMKKEEEKLKMKLLQEENAKKEEEQKKYAQIQAQQMEYLRKIVEENNRKTEMKNLMDAEQKLIKMNRDILLKHYMNLWKKAMQDRKHLVQTIKQIFETNLKKKVVECLKYNATKSKHDKYELSQVIKKCKLQKKYWTKWHDMWKSKKDMQQVAEDYNDFRLSKRSLIALVWNRQKNLRIQDELMLEAVSYHKRQLLMKAMQSLRIYPKLMFEEREKDKRLRSWEEKVKEILPDFSIT